MNVPQNLRYTKDHEWARLDGNAIVIGITDHAQSALGDVVFVELPKTGRTLADHETFGVVESIKAVSDLYSPLAGKVIAVNDGLADDPSKINHDPYGDAWLIKLEAPASSLEKLMSPDAYSKYVASLA